MGSGKTDRPSEKSAGTGKDPGQDLRRDMQRDYIFEKLQRELDRRQADVGCL